MVMMIGYSEMKNHKIFDIKKERLATQCPCCGSSAVASSPAILMPFVADRALGWAPAVIDESWGLSTVKEGSAYSICKSMHCRDCGFLFSDIRFSDAEMENLYKDYRGEDYVKLRELYEPGYSERNASLGNGFNYLEKIEDLLRPYFEFPIAILDWGGDTGKNTPLKGYSSGLDIYDISGKQPVEGARIVTLSEAQAKKYDLIVCSHVLEHVPYPSDLLLKIMSVMGPKSTLYIELPYEDVIREGGENPHTKKRHWHEHINFFTEQSLRCLAENVGLQVINLINDLKVESGGKSLHVFQMTCRLAGPHSAGHAD